MTPTEPEPTEADLDAFWRDLRAKMIPDYLPLEEFDKRMEADAEPLPEETIDRIVDRVTTKAALSSPPPRRQPAPIRELKRWRFSQAAAASTLTALLLSAGLAYVLWPESRDSEGRHGDPLRFDHATIILTDPGDQTERRKTALGRIYIQLEETLDLLKGLSKSGGELAESADVWLLRFRLSLDAPDDVPFHEGTVPHLADLRARVMDGGLDAEERKEALQALGQEALNGVSSIIEASKVASGNAEFDFVVPLTLKKLKARLDK